jgi:uncharacterized repeat protein (TIGR01451 family)
MVPIVVDKVPNGVLVDLTAVEARNPGWHDCKWILDQPDGRTFSCQRVDDMPAGTSDTLVVPFAVDPMVADGTMQTNYVQSWGVDPSRPDGIQPGATWSDNDSRDTTMVEAQACLTASVVGTECATPDGVDCDGNPVDNTDYFGPGSVRIVTAQVSNTGPSTAINPRMTLARSADAEPDLTQVSICTYPLGSSPTDPSAMCSTRDLTTINPATGQPFCRPLTTIIVCDAADENGVPFPLMPGMASSISYPVTLLASDQPGSVHGELVVTSDTPQNPQCENSASWDSPVDAAKSLVCVNKTAGGRNIAANPGEPNNPHLAFANDGTFEYTVVLGTPAGSHYADSVNAVFSDVLPVGLIPSSAVSTLGACNPATSINGSTTAASGTASASATNPQYTVTCNLGVIPGNHPDGSTEPVVITITGKVAPDAAQQYGDGMTNTVGGITYNWAELVPNVATVTYNPIGSQVQLTASDTERIDLVHPATADLAVVKVASTSNAKPGDEITWTMRVTNNGPFMAVDVVLVDEFANPSQVTVASATIVSSSDPLTGSCSTSPEVKCTAHEIVAGGYVEVKVTGRLAADLADGTVVRNTARVSSAVVDPDSANNVASAQVVVSNVIPPSPSPSPSPTTTPSPNPTPSSSPGGQLPGTGGFARTGIALTWLVLGAIGSGAGWYLKRRR